MNQNIKAIINAGKWLVLSIMSIIVFGGVFLLMVGFHVSFGWLFIVDTALLIFSQIVLLIFAIREMVMRNYIVINAFTTALNVFAVIIISMYLLLECFVYFSL